MAIVAINLGAAPSGTGGDTNRDAFEKVNTSFATLAAQVPARAVTANATGAVTLDYDAGDAFVHTMTGNITSLTLTMPDGGSILWRLTVGATPYLLSGVPTVEWLGGRSWSDVSLVASASTVVQFTRIGSTYYASIVRVGDWELDAYKLTVTANGTYPIATDAESIDLANYSKPVGDGSIAFNKNGGSAITARTTFAVGDWLNVVVTGLSTTTAVRIPRYTL